MKKARILAWCAALAICGIVAPRSLEAQCTVLTMSCGETVTSRLNLTSCRDSNLDVYFEVWEFVGVAGQTVTIDMDSITLRDSHLYLGDPSGSIVAEDADGGPGLDARIVYTLPSSGDWRIYAAEKPGSVGGLGTYRLSLSCSGAPASGCGGLPTAMCLNNGRFRIEATYKTAEGASGAAHGVPLTTDSGYFWFFNEANIEAVVKVVNGCGVNDRFWVFAAGLTNVETRVTVTDTQKGVSKTYVNPQGRPFQPIQDTSAFATCP